MGQVEMHLQGRTRAGGDRLSYIIIVERIARVKGCLSLE